MNPAAQPLSPDAIDAIILTASALFLAGLAWGTVFLLAWCSDASFKKTATSPRAKSSQVRLSSALMVTKLVLMLHLLNVGTFMFLNSGWQALAGWSVRLLPERANALIMLLSYYLILAVCTLTRRDIAHQIKGLVHAAGRSRNSTA